MWHSDGAAGSALLLPDAPRPERQKRGALPEVPHGIGDG